MYSASCKCSRHGSVPRGAAAPSRSCCSAVPRPLGLPGTQRSRCQLRVRGWQHFPTTHTWQRQQQERQPNSGSRTVHWMCWRVCSSSSHKILRCLQRLALRTQLLVMPPLLCAATQLPCPSLLGTLWC